MSSAVPAEVSDTVRARSRRRIRATFLAGAACVAVVVAAYGALQRPAFTAALFDDPDLAGELYRRRLPVIAADWRKDRPRFVTARRFSARWSGTAHAERADRFTFHIEAHGGVRLWVDGELLIDRGPAAPAGPVTAQKELARGLHAIVVELVEGADGAAVELFWSSAAFEKRHVAPAREAR
jgi:hypothetical protein